jgi:hypothetical protein
MPNRTNRRIGSIAVLFAALALVLAACGPSSDGSNGSARSNSASGGSSDSDASGDSAGDAASSGDFCAKLQSAEKNAIGVDDDPTAALAALAALEANAPDELKKHFAVMAELIDELAALPSDHIDSMAAAMEIAFRPEVIAAGMALEEYASETCGFDLDSASGGGDFDPIDGDTSFSDDFDDEFRRQQLERELRRRRWPRARGCRRRKRPRRRRLMGGQGQRHRDLQQPVRRDHR